MKDKKIIIFAIDDEPADLELLQCTLEKIPGWKISFTGFIEWETAQNKLKRSDADVIFLDDLLGAVNGVDVIKKMRKSGEQRPIIALTNMGNEYIATEFIKSGADDYLIKTDLTPDMLRRAVEGVMDHYKLTTEKAMLVSQLHQAKKMEALGALTGSIAHDFNNMLASIMGYTDIAILKTRGLDVEKNLHELQATCYTMADLVQRLIRFTRKDDIEQCNMDFKQIVIDAIAFLSHSLPKSIKLIIQPMEESLMINANAFMIQQILLNLGENAAQAMPDGGTLTIGAKSIKADTTLIAANPGLLKGKYIQLDIKDTGCGMEKEVVNRIFEPFFALKELGEDKGTGLGLAVVWNSVKLHNGVMNVESEPRRGTCFTVYLPAV